MKMDVIRARMELPSEGVDLMDVLCITFWHLMALPMSYIYTLLPPVALANFWGTKKDIIAAAVVCLAGRGRPRMIGLPS